MNPHATYAGVSAGLAYAGLRPLCGRWFGVAITVATLCLGGCVTVYQPLVGLQRPTSIDPQEENFGGQSILVRCLPRGHLNAKQAQILCQKVSTLLSNQGAEVQTLVPLPGASADDLDGFKPDLTVDLSTRLVSEQDSTILAVASIWTLTLVPNVKERTYAQHVVIRDRDGFQLTSQTLEARFITYVGAGIWAVNAVLDWLVRDEGEDLGGDTARKDFSHDLFRQLSQATFHASVRARVMRGFAEVPTTDATEASQETP